MAYTEKVALCGTALSFLMYESINSKNGQEGFLIGDITSEITNHISDSQSENARLDTQIVIRTVLPMPSVSLFYCPTGKIKEDVLAELLSNTANEVVGWYKYRRNSNIKPTFRDKLISKGLQKYFEKHHGKKTFVSCNISNKVSICSSTHTFTYRFGKINCFDMYEYIDDVTGNLGEKVTGYKKPHRSQPHSIFNKIVNESNVQSENTSEAILRIQEAVNNRLVSEAQKAVKHENAVRELEAEIKEMSAILLDRQAGELVTAYAELIEKEKVKACEEIAVACVQSLNTPPSSELQNNVNKLNHIEHVVEVIGDTNTVHQRSPSPILPTSHKTIKEASSHTASNSKIDVVEDLISFDEEKTIVKKSVTLNDDITCVDNSP